MNGILLDTDIGTDVDDALALIYAIKRKLPIELITTVHGPTRWRAKFAREICSDLGYVVPVIPGAETALKQPHVFLSGIEGKVGSTEPLDAANAIVSALSGKDRKIVVSIGPLTNIARALQINPAISANIERIYMMGNAILCGDHYHINYRAHNFKVDPEAVDIVMAANIPKTIITTSLCKQHVLSEEEFSAITSKYTFLEPGASQWLKISGNEKAFLYDPFVVHNVIDENATLCNSYGNVKVSVKNNADFKELFLDVVLND